MQQRYDSQFSSTAEPQTLAQLLEKCLIGLQAINEARGLSKRVLSVSKAIM